MATTTTSKNNMNNSTQSLTKMDITVIYGKAGTGKTSKLVNLICSSKDYVVLAPTNAAVENIYKLVCDYKHKIVSRDKFKTTHSFFRIDYENDQVLGALYYPTNIFVDEFGLMNKHLFKRCLNLAELGGTLKLIMCGDALQLNPIYDQKQLISLNKLKRLNYIYNTARSKSNNNNELSHLSPLVIEHLHLSIFGTKRILRNECTHLIQLTTNKRANSVTKEILNNIYSDNRDFNYQFIEYVDLAKEIYSNNYTFIASRYKILQHVYDIIYETYMKHLNPVIIDQHKIGLGFGYNRLYLLSGMSVITCTTVKNEYINGQELIFTGNIEAQGLKCLNPSTNETVYIHKLADEFGNLYYPITPSFLLTVHKSQGRTIDKVIVCIDDMFDVSMLYTAITRAKECLRFYSIKPSDQRIDQLIKSASIPEFKQLNIMVNLLSHQSLMNQQSNTSTFD